MRYSLAQAYLEQAQADFGSYKLLKISNQPVSQCLHFLQMASEKAEKAYLAVYGSNSEQLRKSHLAFGRFIRIISGNKPNAEYPWMLPDGDIRVPCNYDFKEIVSGLESVRGRNLLKILERAISDSQWHKAFRIL